MPLVIPLGRAIDTALKAHVTQAFVAARGTLPVGEPPDIYIFKDSYDLLTPSGFANLYEDTFGTTQGLAQQGCPEEWIPELWRRSCGTPQALPLKTPSQPRFWTSWLRLSGYTELLQSSRSCGTLRR